MVKRLSTTQKLSNAKKKRKSKALLKNTFVPIKVTPRRSINDFLFLRAIKRLEDRIERMSTLFGGSAEAARIRRDPSRRTNVLASRRRRTK